MITIHNAYLSIDILDPVADRDRTGSRYCTGGYVWQVYDRDGRALLSGPAYPNPTPPVFDGQGMPEAFETPLGGGDGAVGEDVCVIGVGMVRKSSDIKPFHARNNPEVIIPCEWDIECGDDKAVMTAEQNFGDKSIRLYKEVSAVDNCVRSMNTVYNTGTENINLRWFAHPFFPPNNDLACGKISPRISMPDNAGYEMGADGMIRMKPDYPWSKGLFQVLDMPDPAEKLSFAVPHPVIHNINVCTTYEVRHCPVWANANTFSFEPFMECTVKPRQSTSWGIEYDFGLS